MDMQTGAGCLLLQGLKMAGVHEHLSPNSKSEVADKLIKFMARLDIKVSAAGGASVVYKFLYVLVQKSMSSLPRQHKRLACLGLLFV